MFTRSRLLTIAAVAASLAPAATAKAVWADAPLGDVWLLSTRQAACCGEHRLADQPARFWQVEGTQWNSQSLDSLRKIGHDDPRRTFIFIHGNRESLSSAITNAEAVRSKLERGGRKYRLLIWAWPSDRVGRRQRPDIQIKHAYTPTQAGYLADLLRQLDHRQEVCLVGYSFGARIAVEAVARLAAAADATAKPAPAAGAASPIGDRIADLAVQTATLPPIRLVLVAAAVDAGDLSPQGRFAAAARAAVQITITRNRFDTALRFYSRMYGRRGPQALGFVGPCGGDAKLRVVELSCAVGKTHAWLCYAAAIDPAIYLAPDLQEHKPQRSDLPTPGLERAEPRRPEPAAN